MKKRLVILLLALSMVGATACSNRGDSTEVTEASTEVNAVEVSDYNYKDYVTLGQYTGFEVKVPTTTVSDDEVDQALEDLRNSSVTYEANGNTTVAKDDYVNMSYKLFKDGEELTDYSTDGTEIQVGAGSFFADLENALVGMNVGEENSVDVSVADDYADSTLAGSTVTYQVTINSIDNKVIPEATDDWIATVSDSKTIDDWKAAKKSELEDSKKEEQKAVFKSGVQNDIMSYATFKDLPQELIDSQIEKYKTEDQKMADSMGYDFNEFITNYYGYDDEDAYTEDLTSYVQKSIQTDFVLQALRDAEGIEMTDDDLKSFEDQCVKYYGFSDTDELLSYYGEDVVKAACLNDKTWNTICDKNTMVEDENYYEEQGENSTVTTDQQ